MDHFSRTRALEFLVSVTNDALGREAGFLNVVPSDEYGGPDFMYWYRQKKLTGVLLFLGLSLEKGADMDEAVFVYKN